MFFFVSLICCKSRFSIKICMWKISDLTLLLYLLQGSSSSLRFVSCFLYKVEALFGQLLSSHRDLLSSLHAIAQLSSKRHAIGHRQAAKYLLTWRKFSAKLVATCNWNVSRLRFGHFIRTESFDQLMSRNDFEVKVVYSCTASNVKEWRSNWLILDLHLISLMFLLLRGLSVCVQIKRNVI